MLNSKWKLESKSKAEQRMIVEHVMKNEQGIKSDNEWKLETKSEVEQWMNVVQAMKKEQGMKDLQWMKV